MGGGQNPNHFPLTSWGVFDEIRKGGAGAHSALEEFSRRYYEPAYRYLRRISRGRLNDDDASDLAQSFFTDKVLAGSLIQRADRDKGSFRVYLKASLRNYVHDRVRRRAGDPLADAADVAELEIPAAADEEFDRAWALALIKSAEPIVKAEAYAKGQHRHYDMFRRRHLLCLDGANEPPSWKQVGAPYGLSEKDAANQAETMRRAFGRTVFRLIVEETGSEDAAREELGALRLVAGKAELAGRPRPGPPPLAELLEAAD